VLEQTGSRFTRIRDHLRAKGVESLIEMIMSVAERDSALLDDLELAAATDDADDEALFGQFKKVITEATRTRGFVEYAEVPAWIERAERILGRIESLIGRGRAELALRLLDHFFARMDAALNSMDDSDGRGGSLYAKACEIHLAACRKAEPDPVALARRLFAREVDDDWDFFSGASETYADVLKDAGLAEYRRLANEAGQKIRPRPAAGPPVRNDEAGMRYRLGAILERFAERDGDVDARIAIRARDLSSAYAYLGIAQLCLDHDREAEALKWAEDGLWQFEDSPNERLVLLAVDLYGRLGRSQRADALLWQTFERQPSMDLYRRLKAAGGTDKKSASSVRDRALATVRSHIDKSGRQTAARWPSPVELLLQLMMAEGLLGEAWEIVHARGCSAALLESLAEASEGSHPAEALQAYADRVERLASLGGQANYEGACRTIERMRLVRERIGQATQHATFLADLMSRHKAKRNFMKLLQAH
jgi:hypothetical protein